MARRTAAVSVVGLTVLLAATACGRGETVSTRPTAGPRETAAPSTGPKASPPASSHANGAAACGTPHLRWKLTRRDSKPHNAPTALLSATNTGPRPCAFDGYPDIDVYVGKGPSVSSKPKKSTSVRLALNAGHTVVFPLFYAATPAPHGSCFIPGDNDPRVSVRPPHAAAHDYGAFAQLTDVNGRRLSAQVCGTTIQLGSPELR
ncbi:DUF4232 domain-containing protein [Streptomyces sp. NPDC001296]